MVDKELFANTALGVTDRFRLLLTLMPKTEEGNKLLKHLAACSIHFGLFARDVYEVIENRSHIVGQHSTEEVGFLKECGCDYYANK